jgi:hypothetical protein
MRNNSLEKKTGLNQNLKRVRDDKVYFTSFLKQTKNVYGAIL